ncbi:cyclin-dependent kinase inhibitor 1C-like [Solenopsis invicta]|uniref:cyclin-dependent kinase inhibitor 1C-like n=1 Tax=Solenopsis invicta TaxID=13686 RepID=UPI00193CE32D|nr:cyclin-dependent kinase inhibitor 1C-like [Solenopsis invicta]
MVSQMNSFDNHVLQEAINEKRLFQAEQPPVDPPAAVPAAVPVNPPAAVLPDPPTAVPSAAPVDPPAAAPIAPPVAPPTVQPAPALLALPTVQLAVAPDAAPASSAVSGERPAKRGQKGGHHLGGRGGRAGRGFRYYNIKRMLKQQENFLRVGTADLW